MNESLHYDYLPDATRIAAEEIEHLCTLQGLFRGLLKQVYEDGRQAAYREMREQRRRDEQEELRKPPRL